MNLEDFLSHEQITIAKREQEKYKIPFVHAVKRLHFIKDLYSILYERFQIQWIDSLPFDITLFHDTGLFLNSDHIAIVLMDPLDCFKRDQAISFAQQKWDLPIRLYWTDPSEILTHITSSDFLLDLLSKTFHASDLHVHRFLEFVDIKIRVDGLLQPYATLSQKEWEPFHNRLKIMANLDIAESRRPQSGHVELVISGHLVDLRVSTHPTIHGENIVIRFLDKHKGVLSLQELGFVEFQIKILKDLISLPYGLILLCGPTGSGKTTTLYSLLSELDTTHYHVATLEDPVEYQLFGISQTEIHYGLLDYKEGIRSLLRQDPDVMLIGEIRDEDTARMAFRASLTGHLVMTTLHVPHALAAKDRLLNLGVAEFEIDHYLKAVIAQKLVRKKCISCSGKGCLDCQNTGQKGRTVLAEIWTPDSFYSMEDHKKHLDNNPNKSIDKS